jgi:hypothetical protein
MKNSATSYISIILLSVLLLAACGGGSNGNSAGANTPAAESNQSANTAKTNVEELGMLIKVPYETEEAVWREDTGAAGKRLAAVLKFSAADADKLTSRAEKVRPPTAGRIEAEPWFPAELIAQAEMSGDDSIKGTSFAADEFFLPPYSEGKITRVENTDYFVLELTAK